MPLVKEKLQAYEFELREFLEKYGQVEITVGGFVLQQN